MIDRSMWIDLADKGNFNTDNYTLLGTSLIQRNLTELGTEFLERAAEQAFDTKSCIAVAEAIHINLRENDWAEKILLQAADHCSDAEHYSQIAEALMTIAEDRTMSISMFKKSIELVTVAHEYMEIASAIVRTLKDTKWAHEVFALYTTVPASGTPIEMLAEEAFHDEIKLLE